MADRSNYGSGYGNSHQSQHRSNYRNEPPQTPEEAYQARHDSRFAKQLESVAAQEAYDKKQNLLEFKNADDTTDQSKVKDVLADYVNAFNKTDYPSITDRREAASAVANTTFQPLYKQVEALEARNDQAIDPKMAEVLRQEHLKYTVVQHDDGSSELKILFRNRKQAEKVEKLTGIEINVVERNRGKPQATSTRSKSSSTANTASAAATNAKRRTRPAS